ncbi:argininosuccinate synthase, partial [mine drainage metagenome]
MSDKVVLAYSGGLDTSVAIPWLKERGLDVVAVTVDVGQPGDLQAHRQKALRIGASDALVVDARAEYAENYIARGLRANALYEGIYPLSTALARPLIGKTLVDIARKVGARKIAHGCTGKGNDQVRFDLCTTSLAPELEVLAPARVWKMTREEEIAYADARGVPVPVGRRSPYSTDENLWGRSVECGVLEDAAIEPPEEAYGWTRAPERAPDTPAYLTIGFDQGLPISIDGQATDLPALVPMLNRLAGDHGVGRIDHIESRVVGIKSREVYECPAALTLTP